MSLVHRFAREDAEASIAEQFETFWRAYPRRVGKGAARKAFERAARLTTLERMLEAVALYQRCKPAYQDFCHPSTWLNQERWDDEWSAPSPARNYADAARNIFNGSESPFGGGGHVQQLPAVERRH